MEYLPIKSTKAREYYLCELPERERELILESVAKLRETGVETIFDTWGMRIAYKALSKNIRASIQNGIANAARNLEKARQAYAESLEESEEAAVIKKCVARKERILKQRCDEKEARQARREQLALEEDLTDAVIVREASPSFAVLAETHTETAFIRELPPPSAGPIDENSAIFLVPKLQPSKKLPPPKNPHSKTADLLNDFQYILAIYPRKERGMNIRHDFDIFLSLGGRLESPEYIISAFQTEFENVPPPYPKFLDWYRRHRNSLKAKK
ncbi:MAG: hypothetical protein LBR73_02260 [Oscillospiraceae bacterium]|nr:hypothetical protein [Oscillospiraceae bacterium]